MMDLAEYIRAAIAGTQPPPPKEKKEPVPLRPSEELEFTEWTGLLRELGFWNPEVSEEAFWGRLEAWNEAEETARKELDISPDPE